MLLRCCRARWKVAVQGVKSSVKNMHGLNAYSTPFAGGQAGPVRPQQRLQNPRYPHRQRGRFVDTTSDAEGIQKLLVWWRRGRQRRYVCVPDAQWELQSGVPGGAVVGVLSCSEKFVLQS